MSIPSDSELLGRAYEEVQRLRAALTEVGRNLHAQLGYNAELNAAIARVRELCENPWITRCTCDLPSYKSLLVSEVLAILDEEQT